MGVWMILQDPTSGIAISYGSCIFFCQSSTLFSIVTAQTYIPTDNDVFPFFHILTNTCNFFFFFCCSNASFARSFNLLCQIWILLSQHPGATEILPIPLNHNRNSEKKLLFLFQWLHLQHTEVPGPRIESKLQLWQHQIPLTHCAGLEIKSTSLQCPETETLQSDF